MKRWLFALVACLFSCQLLAAIDIYQFNDESQEQQFRQLTEQLRCPKCQNNSIADSNSLIAADMRQKVYELMQQGQTSQQIKDYMVMRYGHFVSYDPPLTPLTLLLWILPGVFIAGGVFVMVKRSRQPQQEVVTALSEQQQQRLAHLLNHKGTQK